MGEGRIEDPRCERRRGLQAEYSLVDESYAKLLAKLAAGNFDLTSPQLRVNILDFYLDLSLPTETKKDASQWQ